MTETPPDIIDHLAGIVPGSKGERLRARRPVTKEGAQASWLALFAPADSSQFPLAERFAVAAFVAALHGQPEIAAFYAGRLAGEDNGAALAEAVKAAAIAGAGRGPYGRYPAGPLSAEDEDGPVFTVGEAERAVLGTRLAAALEHAHLLVFHLRDAKPQALGRLIGAGWSTTGIVSLSQLVAFLAFQIRIVAGLKVLNAA
ncbi:CMD domain protein [Rhizobiaceae bacterium BDR2-2]|uniref:CMD domain protein n=1 Tax=Ectorhizobium quercum TaxID=2965071 RepID=A0AAE3SWR4_9HYPH|nr:CMD domain protein [Ectorhizobium quercum]MCX8999680.1 CMD domain protein [Ectorhizobium quercum]